MLGGLHFIAQGWAIFGESAADDAEFGIISKNREKEGSLGEWRDVEVPGSTLVIESFAGIVSEAAAQFTNGNESAVGQGSEGGGLLGGHGSGFHEHGAALIQQGRKDGLCAIPVIIQGMTDGTRLQRAKHDISTGIIQTGGHGWDLF